MECIFIMNVSANELGIELDFITVSKIYKGFPITYCCLIRRITGA